MDQKDIAILAAKALDAKRSAQAEQQWKRTALWLFAPEDTPFSSGRALIAHSIGTHEELPFKCLKMTSIIIA